MPPKLPRARAIRARPRQEPGLPTLVDRGKDILGKMSWPVELIFDLAIGMAKTATLVNTLTIVNLCLKLCLIVLSLYGIAWLNQHSGTTAPLLKIFDLFETAPFPKAYPTLPMDLRPWDQDYLMDSVKESMKDPTQWDVLPKK